VHSKGPGPFLVKGPVAMPGGNAFTTGAVIRESGVYQVIHGAHRLPHEVILFIGEKFPRCARCDEGVTFKLVYPAREIHADRGSRVVLNELPELEDEQKKEERKLAAG
jgi:hypothetical protein